MISLSQQRPQIGQTVIGRGTLFRETGKGVPDVYLLGQWMGEYIHSPAGDLVEVYEWADWPEEK